MRVAVRSGKAVRALRAARRGLPRSHIHVHRRHQLHVRSARRIDRAPDRPARHARLHRPGRRVNALGSDQHRRLRRLDGSPGLSHHLPMCVCLPLPAPKGRQPGVLPGWRGVACVQTCSVDSLLLPIVLSMLSLPCTGRPLLGPGLTQTVLASYSAAAVPRRRQ